MLRRLYLSIAMPLTDLLGAVTLCFILLALLTAVFALVVPSLNRTGNRLIAIYLILTAITVSGFFYYSYFTLPPVLEKLRNDVNLFGPPLFYLFVCATLYQDFHLRRKHLWHAAPFVLVCCLVIPNFYGVANPQRASFLATYYKHTEATVYSLISHLQEVAYLIATFLVLARYRTVLRENYSDTSAVVHRWLWQANVLLSGIFAFALGKNVIRRLTDDYSFTVWIHIGMVSLLLVFLAWLLLKILLNPALLRGIDSGLVPLTEESRPSVYRDLADEQLSTQVQNQLSTLQLHMDQEQPYLESSLTVRELAGQLDWPERELSVLINQHLNRHFFDFVNDYRIEHAKYLLTAPTSAEWTVQEVLYAAGFNSKSSFNVAFKQRTAMTPTQYRREGDGTAGVPLSPEPS